MPKNKVKFGLSNCYYSKITVGEDGSRTYATPKPLKGAVSLSLEAQGESIKWYADNILYYASATNAGYQGPLELADIPDDFRKDILGDVVDETNGIQYERANVEPAHFALLFQFEGDQHGTRHVFFDVVAGRPSVASSTTNETKEPVTSTLDLTAAPLETGVVKGSTIDTTPQATYNDWFKAVTEPSAEVLNPAPAAPVAKAAKA